MARPPKAPLEAPVEEVLLYWQALGIAYQRDDRSLVTDHEYDGLAWWLKQRIERDDLAAGTAIGWEDYPAAAFHLADWLLDS